MPKEYNLTTLKEILEVVNADNSECFKKDFCSWLDFQIGLKIVAEELNKLFELEEIMTSGEMHWIDDGKNEKHITFKIK
jgi:hypothetical protein